MQHMRELMDQAVASSSFDLGDGRPAISVQQLRDLVKRRTWQDREYKLAHGAQLSVASSPLTQFAEFLRSQLEHLVDLSTDRIGHSLPAGSSSTAITAQPDGVTRYTAVSEVSSFAKALIRGAAFLGTERVATLLTGWANDKPVHFKTRVLLNGAGILSVPLSPMDGIRIESLPLSGSQIAFPVPTTGRRSLGDYLARTVITVDHSTTPGLFHPRNAPQVQASRATAIPDVDEATVCAAISLEADTHFNIAFYWTDFTDLAAFSKAHERGVWSMGEQRFRSHSYTNATFRSASHLEGPSMELADDWTLDITEEELGRTLAALAGAPSERLRVAATRWQRSQNTAAGLEDRFIDLRIALESLYLIDIPGDTNQEMSFRLALYGAWHLGTDYQDRRTIRKALRDAYGTASKAVHRGHVKSTPITRNLLSEAQALCRRGTLRLLKDGEPQDWESLILGADEQSGRL